MTDIEERHYRILMYFDTSEWVNLGELAGGDNLLFSELANEFSYLTSKTYGLCYLLSNKHDFQIQQRGKNRLAELKAKKKKEDDKENIEGEIKQLDRQVKQLQIDNFEYERENRKLKEELQISSILRNYWYLWSGAIALGIAIAKWVLPLLIQLLQK